MNNRSLPNGICFSPEYTRFQLGDTGSTHIAESSKNVKVWDLNGKSLRRGRQFVPPPVIGSNLCSGGRERKRLLMTARQPLYAVYLEEQGAHIA